MENNRPKISIVSPVFNVEKFLARCLDSLVNQTLLDIEIILVDDKSSDKSLEICKEYAQKDSRIKVVELEDFKGVSAARNEGLKLATGEFIGFVDSDDYVDLNFYEKLYNSAIKNDADIAYSSIIRKYPNKEKFRLKIDEEKISTEDADKFFSCKVVEMPSIWNKIYRKTYFDRVGLDFVEGMYYEDKLFVAKAVHFANKVVGVPEINYYYMVNPVSIVRRRQDKKLVEDKIRAKRDTLHFAKAENIKLPDGYFTAMKKELKIGKLPIYTINESLKSETHLLLGVLPIYKKRTYDNAVFINMKGRQANQMFEWAFGKAFEAKTGYEVIFDDSEETFKLKCFELSHYIKTIEKPLYKKILKKIIFIRKLRNKLVKIKNTRPEYVQKDFSSFEENLFEIKPPAYIDGYFQSYKYFEDVVEDLRKDFKLTFKLNSKNKKMLERIKNTNSISMHFRRGDYLKARNQKVYGSCSMDYYKNAVKLMKEKIKEDFTLFIFSDDPIWVKKNANFDCKTVVVDINSGKHGWFDLELMKNCNHNIIANSSFSWWGAFLNENSEKIVVAPEYWQANFKSNSDIIPENWYILENK